MNIADIAAIVNGAGGGGGAGGSAYDFVLNRDAVENTWSLIEGEFSVVKNKIENLQPVTGFLAQYDTDELVTGQYAIYYAAYIDDNDIVIDAFTILGLESLQLVWSEDGTVTRG